MRKQTTKKQKKQTVSQASSLDKTAARRYLTLGVSLILVIIVFFWGWSFKISIASLNLKKSKEKTLYSNAQEELEKIFNEAGLATTETEKNNSKQDIAAALKKIIADKQNQ